MYQNRPAASGPNFLTQGTVRVFAMKSKLRIRRSEARRIAIHTMALSNYRDISPPLGDVGAGFQFEFFCESCGDTWKTPFKPYRAGQANGIFRRFGYLFNEFAKISVISEIDLSPRPGGRHVDRGDRLEGKGGGARGGAGARGAALREVQQLPDDGLRQLLRRGDPALRQVRSRPGRRLAERHLGERLATVCPNCQTPSQGGRFCHECGFDMASTHKSCPACSATMPRQARFCTDCGHGF